MNLSVFSVVLIETDRMVFDYPNVLSFLAVYPSSVR